MRTHQSAMDVIGTNIANVNTVGYKAGRMSFKEAIYQSYTKGTAPATDGTVGGVNPVQVGLGVTMGGIDNIMTQGTSTSTGKGTDLMIQGEGFFMLSKSTASTANGTPDCYTRDGSFSLDADNYLVDPTTGAYVLAADTTSATTSGSKIQIPSTWKSFSIGADGTITGVSATGELQEVGAAGGAAGGTAVAVGSGLKVGIAKFPNPAGLSKIGGNYYEAASNAGTMAGGAPGASGNGSVVSGSLEASNVDLAEQFSRMIMAQRGFQANSRIITTSDSMLEELVNLKR